MTVQMLLSIAAVVLFLVAPTISAVYGAEPPRVQISEIKAHPDRYDGRMVELLGILDSGHLGVFLRNRSSDAVIRLRLTLADPADDAQTVKDKLFDQLRGLAAKTEVPGEQEKKFEVLVVGRIRVLKNGGKPRRKYYPQIESPVEVIAIRVLSISNVGAKR